MRAAIALAALGAAAACGSFENPEIVIDLRVLAIVAEPPEQVVAFDPADPPGPEDLDELGLVDVEVCALVADPGAARRLAWEMTLCAPGSGFRCDPERVRVPLGGGVIDDPESSATPQRACATVRADPALLLVVEDAVALDDLAGFGGVDVLASLEVWPEGEDRDATAIFAGKRVRYSPQLPPERVANRNPTLDRIDIEVEGRDPIPLPLGRCATQDDPVRIAPGEELPLVPVEPEGAREDYVVPTFDGGSRRFTETLRYQWLATAGDWTRGSTGGTRDASGTLPPLDTRWIAPDDVTDVTDVTLWVIQRDERAGQAWYEACVRVTP